MGMGAKECDRLKDWQEEHRRDLGSKSARVEQTKAKKRSKYKGVMLKSGSKTKKKSYSDNSDSGSGSATTGTDTEGGFSSSDGEDGDDASKTRHRGWEDSSSEGGLNNMYSGATTEAGTDSGWSSTDSDQRDDSSTSESDAESGDEDEATNQEGWNEPSSGSSEDSSEDEASLELKAQEAAEAEAQGKRVSNFRPTRCCFVNAHALVDAHTHTDDDIDTHDKTYSTGADEARPKKTFVRGTTAYSAGA